MCGIAGILTARSTLELHSALEPMRAALAHRGPDGSGCVDVALPGGLRLGLVHTRLAILDLSQAGQQPMHDPESETWITYNGEVYNHQDIRRDLPGRRYHSQSDTETLLAAWGHEGAPALGRLRGMFAFALYDGRRRELWLVRDRLGVKPLYVSRVAPDTWVFASEVRALLASGLCERHLDPAALHAYLAFGAAIAPHTFVQGVESLLPGEAWRFRLDPPETPLEPERRRYWRPRFARADAEGVSYAEAVEQLRRPLLEAVGLRMVADVPVGVFLSGGIDSGSVVAALASQGHRLRTFSVVFGERHYDESEQARQVAHRFGTEHAELFLQPARVLEEFDQALGAYDQPSIDGVNTYCISKATRQAGVKVALSGLGGDELFAGYPYFRYLARLQQPLARVLAHAASRLLCWLFPASSRTTKLEALLRAGTSRVSGYLACRQLMAPARRAALLRCALQDDGPIVPAIARGLEAETSGLDAVNAHSLLELSLYLADMLLRDTDQMSMAHALEVREPLLDHVLVETVAALPGPVKLARGRQSATKGLLVDALPAMLPRAVVRKRKMGFVFPWERWLRHELRERVADALTDQQALVTAGLSPEAVAGLWRGFLTGQPGIRYTDVLALVHLLHWVRLHRLSLGVGTLVPRFGHPEEPASVP